MTALLYTGGLDSVMLAALRPDAEQVYVTIGHAYQDEELEAVRVLDAWTGRSTRIVAGSTIGHTEQPDGHILHRNLLLIVSAAAATGHDELLIGSVRGEASPDKSRRFLRAAGAALSASEHRRVTVHAPLRQWTKARCVKAYLEGGGDPSALWRSRSCYRPILSVPCGECQACFRRWVAMTLNNLVEVHAVDPSRYGARQMARRDQIWKHLRGTDMNEWWGMMLNNLDAVRALQLHRSNP